MTLIKAVAQSAASVSGEAAQGDMMSMLIGTVLPIAAIVAVMYFFMIRPESKRKKEAEKMRNELIVGDEVTTRGGIVGKVVNIKDDTVTIETGADKVRIKMMRWSILSKGTQVTDQG
jgi:preprotein translocase subunit YajC